MFLRLLFLLLLALNLGVAGWLVFGDKVPPLPPVTDPGVPELRLLSEQGSPTNDPSAELTGAPQSIKPQQGDRCFSLGPFPTEADVRKALDAMSPHVSRIQFRQEQATASRGWWVFLPALPDRDSAIKVARQLSDKGVRDYYVVTAGDRQNTISLGLFHDPANAERRRAEIAALGFKPSLNERTEQLPLYYVDYALAAGQNLDWASYLGNRSDLTRQPMGCF
ncbi:MAG TPA: SPOR domain-containing protein [Rhodanobacteraceae bacterium]|nr:SPOR domain-containing protein [Rhodanobacteraceae bacterium]